MPWRMPRKLSDIDCTPFAAVIAEADAAYRLDADLSCQMANAACRVLGKRASWTARKDLRAASAAAVAECTELPEFTCTARGVCGTGPTCKFATGDLVQLDIETQPGKDTRPQPHTDGPSFDVESGVKPLVALRTSPRRAA